MNLLKDMY